MDLQKLAECTNARLEMQESGVAHNSGAIPVEEVIDYILHDEEKNLAPKKVYISVPMEGRTDEAIAVSIREMLKIAETMVGEKLEPVHNHCDIYIPESIRNNKLYREGIAVQKVAECDYFIGIDYCRSFKECHIENYAACEAQIKRFYINMDFCWFLEDAKELDMKYGDSEICC